MLFNDDPADGPAEPVESHEEGEYSGPTAAQEATMEGMKEDEEFVATRSLDKEHMEDYLAIKHAVGRTDLALALVELAVTYGLADRTQ